MSRRTNKDRGFKATRRELLVTSLGLLISPNNSEEGMFVQQATASNEENDIEKSIALLIEQHNLSLTEAQRRLLPQQLQELKATITALRKFPLQDGDSDPATLLPILPVGRRPS